MKTVGQEWTLPIPVGGLDAKSALSDMPETNAVTMDNWIPGTDSIILRRGSLNHATGMIGAVESLLPYVPTTGVGQMFAASGSGGGYGIYDVTSSGVVGAAVVTGLTNARFQYVQMGTAGGNFLLAMNGADTPRTYDGTVWANTTITGPTVNNLIWCNSHNKRLWFGEKDSLSAWYLPVNSIGGAATEFPFAGIAKGGGYIVGMGTWTRDGGSGADDVAVFLTSEGEAILYSGIDPSAAATWALIGVFDIGSPIGRRCMIKSGADLIMLTQDGAIFASSLLGSSRSDKTQHLAITAQINPLFNTSVRDFADLYGWEPFMYPRGALLFLNIPQSATVFHQYVFNFLTGAPCRFTDLNAVCWGLLNDKPYFGTTDGRVVEFDVGYSDNGANIVGDMVSAFINCGYGGIKNFKLVNLIMGSNAAPSVAASLFLDYATDNSIPTAQSFSSQFARWGISKWGMSFWGTAFIVFKSWRGVSGNGKNVALRIRVSTNSYRPSLLTSRLIYTKGAGI